MKPAFVILRIAGCVTHLYVRINCLQSTVTAGSCSTVQVCDATNAE